MTELTFDEKREYLELYALQIARINRLYLLSVKNADKSKKYEAQLNSAKSLRDIIEYDIEKLPDKFESEILAQKYLCGKSLEETAEILNYSKRQVERIHLTAIEHLKPTYKKNEESEN